MSFSAQNGVYKGCYEELHDSTDVVHCENHSLPHVLLIDEQAHVLRVMRLNLDRLGCDVEMAMNSQNAVNMVQQKQYDVVIITSDLPEMSAQQLCEIFEFNSAGSKCPLTLVSGAANDSWISNSTFAEKLDKPVSLRWIVARLSEVFSGIKT